MSNYDLVEKSFEKVRENYICIFNEAPQLKPLFEHTNIPKQSEKRLLLVENIRDAELLKSVLEPLGEKHKGYGAIEQHYPMVGSIAQYFKKHYLGDAWDQPTEEAWTITYGAVVEMMLNGVTSDPENIPIEEEPELEQSTNHFDEDTIFRPRKKLYLCSKS